RSTAHPASAVRLERRGSTCRPPGTRKAATRHATAGRSAPVLGSGPDDDPGPGAGPGDGGGPLGAATGTVTVDGADSTTVPRGSVALAVAVFVRASAGREGTGSARRASADRVTTVEAGAVASATAALTKPPASTSSCCTT